MQSSFPKSGHVNAACSACSNRLSCRPPNLGICAGLSLGQAQRSWRAYAVPLAHSHNLLPSYSKNTMAVTMNCCKSKGRHLKQADGASGEKTFHIRHQFHESFHFMIHFMSHFMIPHTSKVRPALLQAAHPEEAGPLGVARLPLLCEESLVPLRCSPHGPVHRVRKVLSPKLSPIM